MPYPARLLDTFQGRTTLSAPFPVCTGVPLNAITPRLCLRRLVLTNSTSLAPPQAAGLVRSVARPLQIANAPLVCNLVPSVLPEKNGEKRGAWGRAILRAHAREFLAAPRPERPVGRKTVTFPIAVGSDIAYRSVGADGERSRQRQRSATDAAHPLRVHIGPFGNRRVRRRFP